MTVRVVAADAAFAAGRVLEEERTALLGMAGMQLSLIQLPSEAAHVGRPVRVMAGAALHLAFRERHVRHTLDLGRLRSVT